MEAVIFVGPTLPLVEARKILDARYLPPVAQGDVYRVALDRPRSIGIIDGYFERTPAVWHKEILWAMEQGIHVYGSASMGALRAAELHTFGMIGIGRIFEDYRDGILEDDDEVALVHGPAEAEYVTMSDPMVNVRATLLSAETAGIISRGQRETLIGVAKKLFYPERRYAEILRYATESGVLHGQQVHLLDSWIAQHKIDQKRLDALAMLHEVKLNSPRDLEPKQVHYRMELTEWWDRLQRYATKLGFHDVNGDRPLDISQLFDEIRIAPEAYRRIARDTVLRHLTVCEATRRGWEPEEAVISRTVEEFRRVNGLDSECEFNSWSRRNGITPSRLSAAIRELIIENNICNGMFPGLLGQMQNMLCTSDELGQWMDRAVDKIRFLAAQGLTNPNLLDLKLTKYSLVEWYFRTQANKEPPTDLSSYAVLSGFQDEDAFVSCIAKEFIYMTYRRAPQP